MSSEEKYGLKLETLGKILKVFSKYPKIQSVVLYGSRAKGNFERGSDIDLTFRGNNLDTGTLSKVENDLDDLSLPYKFDLSAFNDIEDPGLTDHIQRVGIEIFQQS